MEEPPGSGGGKEMRGERVWESGEKNIGALSVFSLLSQFCRNGGNRSFHGANSSVARADSLILRAN